ncbi:unnamed protein product [Auanema sp. JU1783]|nr:unnamed protein product [Auanema sp. JU1783]
MSKEAYYAVARGRNVGIYSTWDMCKVQVDGFNNARYKKFASISEAAAFVDSNKESSAPAPHTAKASSSSNGGSRNSSNRGTTSSHIRSSNYNVGSNSSKLSNQRGASSSSLRTVGKRSYAVANSNDDSGDEDYAHPAKRTNIKTKQPSSASRSNCPVVYTDGACSSNGRHGAKAGWGVYWGDGHPDNSCGPVDGSATNNRGELQAVAKAIEKARDSNVKEMIIRTDSQLCINSCDTWINKWERNGWKTTTGDVKNKDLLVQIQNLRKNVNVHFEKVKAHCGEPGNEAADELARKGAESYRN